MRERFLLVDVQVTTPGGTSPVTAADQFTYVVPPVPAVTGVGPASGTTAGGFSVYVTGTGFTGASAISFGGTAGVLPTTIAYYSLITVLAVVAGNTRSQPRACQAIATPAMCPFGSRTGPPRGNFVSMSTPKTRAKPE